MANRTRGANRIGGRKKGDPNIVHTIRIGSPKYKWPKPASEVSKTKGGKVKLTLHLPAELYEQIRVEARERKESMNYLALSMLGAAAADFPEE